MATDIEVLECIWDECDEKDSSTEYMIARMMNATDKEYDEIIDFLITHERKLG